MIPLTLRAMIGIPHHPRNSARPSFALLSVLALLALACFPVLAQAEESSGAQYELAVPTATGHTSPPKGGSGGTSPAHSSATGGGSPTSSSGSSGDSGNAGAGSPSGSSANNNPSTAGNGSTGEGSRGNGPTGAGKTNAQQGQNGSQAKNLNGTQTSSDDGSSPLVPILIAVAVLAAISIAAVVIRQRRQRDGSGAQVSPKAS
jgi:cobalamin biosynthesis Mg chelatase CobN